MGDLAKLIVAKGFKKLPKVRKIAKSGHTARHLSLERAEKVTDEGMFAAQRQHLPLDEGAFDVVVLQDLVLLQTLDGIEGVVRVPQLGKYDLKNWRQNLNKNSNYGNGVPP